MTSYSYDASAGAYGSQIVGISADIQILAGVQAREATAGAYGDQVGFDPSRKHQRTNFDYFFVAGAIAVCLVLVLWAFFG